MGLTIEQAKYMCSVIRSDRFDGRPDESRAAWLLGFLQYHVRYGTQPAPVQAAGIDQQAATVEHATAVPGQADSSPAPAGTASPEADHRPAGDAEIMEKAIELVGDDLLKARLRTHAGCGCGGCEEQLAEVFAGFARRFAK